MCDLGARIFAIGIITVRIVIGKGPSSVVSIIIPVVLGSLIFVVTLNATVEAIEPDLSITTFVVSELLGISHANKRKCCKSSQRYFNHI